MAGYVPLNQDRYSGHQLILGWCGAPAKALDVGGSSGYLAMELAGRGTQVTVLDRDVAALREAQRLGLQTCMADLATDAPALPAASFDLVICADVIEHLADPLAALLRLRTLLRDDGSLICSVPNGANWALRLSLLGGRWDYRDRGLLDRTHLRVFTRKTFHATLLEAGFGIVQTGQTCPIPRFRGGRLSAAAHGLAGLLPGLLAYQHLALARPLTQRGAG